jgi:two-component system, chemotaxis family, chemotaxis protein CheY
MQKTVLIVDDSATMRNMLKASMQELDFDVHTAQDGEKAMKSVELNTYDVILTDINMPNVDGIELIRLIRENPNNKSVPILVITTEGGDAAKLAGREAGANGWIVKPCDPEILKRAVAKLCGISAAA